jgi:ferredoxin
MSKITVDKSKCIACGTCYSMYPECFMEGAEGKSDVKDHDYKTHGYTKEDIITTCPSEAISIED